MEDVSMASERMACFETLVARFETLVARLQPLVARYSRSLFTLPPFHPTTNTPFRANGLSPPRSFNDCENPIYLKVKPRRGKLILFYSLKYSGDLDAYSLHGGCPVKEGTKWSGNKVRRRRIGSRAL